VKQVVQPLSGGPVTVLEVPRPVIGPTEVLVRTQASIISPGTEKAVTALAQSSLLQKAKARPDLVRQVLQKARTEGVAATSRALRSRLAEDLPLGYSAAGIAVQVGSAVSGIRPGQLIATGGAGKANHAEWQAVPGLLCAAVPEGVPAEEAAFATVASIALHGLRLAEVGPGSKVVVIGLGLVGQLAARLAMASGCDVAGIDVGEAPLAVAERSGVLALKEQGQATTDAVLAWSRARGADAVLICAADKTSAVAERTPALCRDKASVVVVGDIGLNLSRTPFYEKELSVCFARSYGPGRYERSYEDWGVDYPAGQLRWTEGRNLEAVLDLIAGKRLRVDDLITHRFAIGDAGGAYELIESRREPYLAIAIGYPAESPSDRPVSLAPRRATGTGQAVGWIGAGAFSTGTLLPAFRAAGFERFVSIASASGLSARRTGERHGFEQAVSSAEAVIDDPDVDVVVIATPHDTHADLVVAALNAGKHVWCEKPLALSEEELNRVELALGRSNQVLFIGYNRRWSPAVQRVSAYFSARTTPLSIVYRIAAGPVPEKHWYADRRQGGRLAGEVCHFVDTCQAMAGVEIAAVRALAGGSVTELGLATDVGLLVSFLDGSLATIAYTSARPTGGKEHIELMCSDQRAVIDDFRHLVLGTEKLSTRQDKGHQQAVNRFRAAVMAGQSPLPGDVLSTARTTLAAIQSSSSSSD